MVFLNIQFQFERKKGKHSSINNNKLLETVSENSWLSAPQLA
jgi:hypothetical protein